MRVEIYPVLDGPVYDSAYSALLPASDGHIYFGLCTHMPQKSAGLFRFNKMTKKIEFLYDMAEAIKGGTAHGKIHTKLVEDADANIYFATHFAYPYGLPQKLAYEGGHLLRQCHQGEIEDLGIAREGDGIINIEIDQKRSRIYLLTIPSGHLVYYDIVKRQFTDLGALPSVDSICRSITIDGEGNVYGSYDNGGLFVYEVADERLVCHDGILPYSKEEEWNSASRGGVNRLSRSIWRSVTYDAQRNKIYGVLSTRSLAFSLNLTTLRSRSYEPMLSDNTPKDRADLLYPTLSATANSKSLFYASSNGLFDYCRSENMEGWSHLLAVDKSTGAKTDLGLLVDNGRKVYGVAGAALQNEKELWLLGAVESRADEAYNPFNIIAQQPFHLGLIHVRLA